MRKKIIVIAVGLLVGLITFLLAETLLIKVQTTSLRQRPEFYAPILATLNYGDKVEKLTEEGGWVKVRTGDGLIGWLHSSAVETKKIRLLAMNQTLKTEATSQEVALASKGFTKDLEKAFRQKNKGLNYAQMEKMLRIKVSRSELKRFLREGKLGEWGRTR
jgi:SH3-like domain-containing protein